MIRRVILSTAVLVGTGAISTSALPSVCNDPLTASFSRWPPYNMKTKDGWAGIDIDILKMIGEKIGCEVAPKKMPWTRGKFLIEHGEIDLGMHAGITEERQKYADYSDAYMKFQSSLWVRKSSREDYDSLAAFLRDGNMLAIKEGYEYGEDTNKLIRESYPDQVVSGKNLRVNVRVLARGRVDGMLGTPFVVEYRAREEGVGDQIEQRLVVQSEPMHVMVSEKSVSQAELDAINEAIATLKEEGKIQQVVKEYTGTTMQ